MLHHWTIKTDGAQSLRTFRQDHFREATFILDWYHAVEHLSGCARAAFGESSEESVAWYKRVKKKLWLGDLDGVIASIEKERRDGLPALPGGGLADRLGRSGGHGQAVRNAAQGKREILERVRLRPGG